LIYSPSQELFNTFLSTQIATYSSLAMESENPMRNSASNWLRDSLHELRRHAEARGLSGSSQALRQAIIDVSQEQGIPNLLRVSELVEGSEHEAERGQAAVESWLIARPKGP
jgi:hypothetical protein